MTDEKILFLALQRRRLEVLYKRIGRTGQGGYVRDMRYKDDMVYYVSQSLVIQL